MMAEDYPSILQKDQLGRDDLIEFVQFERELTSELVFGRSWTVIGCQILLSQDMATCFIFQKFDGLKVLVHIYDGLFEVDSQSELLETSLCSQVIL